MAMAVMSWMLAIPLLGFCTGLRAMTPIAVLCWYACLGYLPVQGTWAFWIANPIAVGVFTVLALGEYVGDKLPNTPSRLSPFALAARVAFGGLVGALAATGLKGSAVEGIVLGVISAVIGSFAGYGVRRHLTYTVKWPDLPVAIAEDLVALLLSILALGIATG